MRQHDLCVLIPAAGAGLRLGEGPKALLELDGRPLVRWLADKCLLLSEEVVVAAPVAQLAQMRALLPDCRVIVGGATRQESLHLLFEASQAGTVIITDAARPFLSTTLLQRVIAAMPAEGGAGAFLSPEVPVARLRNGMACDPCSGSEVGVFQSPQCFPREVLQRVFALARTNGWQTQSTADLAMRAGVSIVAVAGEKTNIKITTREDWLMAQGLLEYLR